MQYSHVLHTVYFTSIFKGWGAPEPEMEKHNQNIEKKDRKITSKMSYTHINAYFQAFKIHIFLPQVLASKTKVLSLSCEALIWQCSNFITLSNNYLVLLSLQKVHFKNIVEHTYQKVVQYTHWLGLFAGIIQAAVSICTVDSWYNT